MAEESEQDIIHRFAQFVLNRKTQNIREELHEYLISIALLENKDGLNSKEISNEIEVKMGLSKFPEVIITESLERLLSKDKIRQKKLHDGTTKYILLDDESITLEKYSAQYNNVLNNIFEDLFSKIEKSYRIISKKDKQKIRYIFIVSFGHLLDKFGRNIASIFYKGKIEDIALPHIQHLEKTLYKKLNDIILDKNLIKVIITKILTLTSNPSKDFSRFLFAISQSYYLIELLNLDPKCQRFMKARLSSKKLYLDTNILIDLFFGEEKYKKITKTELDLSRNLGFNLFVSNRTVIEFKNWLREKKKYSSVLEQITGKRFGKTKDILEDGVIKDFLLKKQKQPSLTWDGFTAKYDNVELLLKEKFKIEIDTNFKEEIKDDKNVIENLIPIVQYCGFDKSNYVAEHDASHIIFIQKQRDRKKSDVLGPNFWFITHDSTLQMVEQEFHPALIPSTILGCQWVQMISPFLAPDISTKDNAVVFGRIFSSALTSSKILREDQWIKIQGPWLDADELSSDLIERIVGDKFVRNVLEKPPDQIKTSEIPDAISKSSIKQIRIEIRDKKRIEETYSQQIKKINSELEEQKNKINQQEGRINQQEQKIDNIKESVGLNISDLKKDKRISVLVAALLIVFSILVDFAIYHFLPLFWDKYNGIIFTLQVALILVPLGLQEFIKRQIKKLEQVK